MKNIKEGDLMSMPERKVIKDEFDAIIKDHLRTYRIGKGVQEYERAKRMILHGDMGTGEYHRAIKVIAEWTGV